MEEGIQDSKQKNNEFSEIKESLEAVSRRTRSTHSLEQFTDEALTRTRTKVLEREREK